MFIDLAAVDDADRVATSAATACGIMGGVEPVSGIVGFAGDTPTLLVLDNCEHVASAAADLAARLVDESRSITLLATSQVPLAATAEALLPVGALTDDSDGESCAVQLFAERAAALGSPVTEADATTVRAIVERLDRIPLAIELAASLTPTLSPREIASRLDDRFELLADLDGGADRRHTTLLQTLASSFERLGDDEQRLARRLAVCVGQFSFEAVEGLADGLRIQPLLQTVHRLVRASWLVREAAPAGSRYRILESLREFARREAGEEAWAESRRVHAHYFLGEHALWDRGGFPNDYADFAAVDDEIANIISAFDWAATTGEELDAAASTHAWLVRYWQARPGWTDVRSMLERLVEAGLKEGRMSTGLLSETMSSLAFYRSMVDGVDDIELMAQAEALAEESGDERARIRATHIGGQIALRRGEHERALRLANACIEAATAIGNPFFRQMGLYRRAIVRFMSEGVGAAEEDFAAALALSREIGDPFGVAFNTNALVDVERRRGNAEKALEYARAGRAAAEEAGHFVGKVVSATTIAQLTLDSDELIPFLEGQLLEARRIGSRPLEGDVCLMLVQAARRAGDLHAASAHMAAFDSVGRAYQAFAPHMVNIERAQLLHAQGRLEEARAAILEALAKSTGPADTGAAWDLIGRLAHWRLASHDPVRNRAIEVAAATAYRQFGDPRDLDEQRAWRAANPDTAEEAGALMSLDEAIEAVLNDGT